MAIREKIKDDWIARSRRFWKIAFAQNRTAKWCNDFDAVPPLLVEGQRNGVVLRFAPWESPFVHPFQVYMAGVDGKVNVREGYVYDGGAARVLVTALTNVTCADGLKIWLKVKRYYDTTTASEIALDSGTAWPSNAHTSAHQLEYRRVAEIDGITLYQYLYEDQYCVLRFPPLPDTTNTYYLRAKAGVIAWIQAGAC